MQDREAHTGAQGAMDKMQDMVGGMVGMASASTAGSHDTGAFVKNACIGDLYEIDAAKLALQRSRTDEVRSFAQMMVDHHMTAAHQMVSALKSSEVTRQYSDLKPTTELDERRKGMIEHLEKAPDQSFDDMYLDQQKMAHQEAIALHKGYAESGDNAQLRSVAAGALPMVQRHLERLEQIRH
ncbi:MAG: DUF4142 domain-containing protein [Phenylobacterium sp.]|uniref:DUF4142 domain-containing protein n=1 Tax=Phenylobacterium sp. TaxID=1871053 RepID=UPI00391AA2CB